MNWLKRIFCRHDYSFSARPDRHEDTPRTNKYTIAVYWRCKKCGKCPHTLVRYPTPDTMTKEDIDDLVCEILHRFGPDGHIDGHEVLTELIVRIRAGDGLSALREWIEEGAP